MILLIIIILLVVLIVFFRKVAQKYKWHFIVIVSVFVLCCLFKHKIEYLKSELCRTQNSIHFEAQGISYLAIDQDTTYIRGLFYSYLSYKDDKIDLVMLKQKIDSIKNSFCWSNKHVMAGNITICRYSDDIEYDHGSICYAGKESDLLLDVEFNRTLNYTRVCFNTKPLDEKVSGLPFKIIMDNDTVLKVMVSYDKLNRIILQEFIAFVQGRHEKKYRKRFTYELYKKNTLKEFSITYVNYGLGFDFKIF